MKLINIQNKEVNVDVRPSNYPRRYGKTRQSYVGELLDEKYPTAQILEEFTIPGSRMSLDFYIPRKSLAIEVQGEQHQERVPFFHGDRSNKNFYKQKNRDQQKRDWCELNQITLIEIFPKEKEEEINAKI